MTFFEMFDAAKAGLANANVSGLNGHVAIQIEVTEDGCGCESVDFSQNLMNLCRDDLLKAINEVSFAMYDCCLFLDTHPMDSCALDYFQKMKKKRKAAMDIYTRKFGPLVLDCAGDGCTWDWGQEPLPWE